MSWCIRKQSEKQLFILRKLNELRKKELGSILSTHFHNGVSWGDKPGLKISVRVGYIKNITDLSSNKPLITVPITLVELVDILD